MGNSPEPAHGQGVVDLIFHINPVATGVETMPMVPIFEWTLFLLINEHFPWHHVRDLCDPSDPDEWSHPQGVDDDLSRKYGCSDGLGSHREFRRGNLLKITGIGKKLPDAIDGGRQILPLVEGVYECEGLRDEGHREAG